VNPSGKIITIQNGELFTKFYWVTPVSSHIYSE